MTQRLSVVITVYNGDDPLHFKIALSSIVSSQTREPDEIVLVIDGDLNNELSNVVKKFSSLIGKRLKVIRLLKNQGLGTALNAGLLESTGNWVARMDSDDVSLPHRFETQLNFLKQNTEVDILGSGAYEIDLYGQKKGERRRRGGDAQIKKNLWANPLIHSSIIFSREKILSLGGYNPELRYRQDYELWFRAAQAGLIFDNIQEPLLSYRFDRATLARQTPVRAFEQALIGYRGCRRLDCPLWKSFLCFLPFFRAFLPLAVQLKVVEFFKVMDPR